MNFYEFNQNNSGGVFHVDHNLCHRIFIEAETVELANERAEELGCYWDGVSKGIDCECCGDRWNEAYSPVVFPIKWSDEKVFNTISEYSDFLVKDWAWTTPDVRIFFADGIIKEFFPEGRKECLK